MVTVLVAEREARVADGGGVNGGGADDQLWLPVEAAAREIGWEVKPEGFCRGETCVPIPPGRADEFLREGRVNVAAFWRHMGRPLLHDEAGETWCLGESAADRRAQLNSLEAADFALPDLQGKIHRLSHYRGRKVLLVTWASW